MNFLFTRSHHVIDADYDLKDTPPDAHQDLIFIELAKNPVPYSSIESAFLVPDSPPPQGIENSTRAVIVNEGTGMPEFRGDQVIQGTTGDAALLREDDELHSEELTDGLKYLTDDTDLWHIHPSSLFFLTKSKARKTNLTSLDIHPEVIKRCNGMFFSRIPRHLSRNEDMTRTHDPLLIHKDIGNVPVIVPPCLPHSLKSSEQEVLKNVQDFIGD